MELQTERLLIIPCTKDTVTIALNQRYENGTHISTYLKQLDKDPSLLCWGSWLVLRKADGIVIGDIGFKGKPDINRVVEVGYGFLKEYWNNGYATEAVGKLIQWAFSTSSVDKVIAETLHTNDRSIRVLEKLNMQQVGKSETMIYWERLA
jgi:ribosomal-protein-alanine N-acetyltransferase